MAPRRQVRQQWRPVSTRLAAPSPQWQPVGSFIQATATGVTSTTVALTNLNLGDIILLAVRSTTAASLPQLPTGGGATWQQVGTTFVGTTNAEAFAVYAGTITALGSQTATVSISGAAANIRVDGYEFVSPTGQWALDQQSHLDSGGTSTWPSLTPLAPGELYFGSCQNATSAVPGTTQGYAYFVDVNSNGTAFNPVCGPSATGPVWGDSGQTFGIMVLITAYPPAPSAPVPQPGGQPGWRRAVFPQRRGRSVGPVPTSGTRTNGYPGGQFVRQRTPLAAVPPRPHARVWAPPVPPGDQVTLAPPAQFTGRRAVQVPPRRGHVFLPEPPVTAAPAQPFTTFTGRRAQPPQQGTRRRTVVPVPPGTPGNGRTPGTVTGRSSRQYQQPRRGHWWGPVPPGVSNIPPLPYSTFTGRRADLGVKPRRGRTWTPVPPGTPTTGREAGTVAVSRRFPAPWRRGRVFAPVPPGDQVTAPPPQVTSRPARAYQQPRRGRIFVPASVPVVQAPSGRQFRAWVSRRFPPQWRRSVIRVVPQPPAGGAPFPPGSNLGGTITLPGYGGVVALPGYGGTITLPGYGGVVTLPGWGGTITPGGPVVAQQQDIAVPVGDDEFLPFAITNNGVPVNLTGYGVTVYLKANRYQPNTQALATYTIGSGITITNLAGGLFTLNVPRSALPVPAAQWYRCDITDASGNVYTALYGNLTVQAI